MRDYKVDFAANTVTVTKAFAEKANQINTEEYKTLMQLKKDFPGIDVVYKTRRRSTNVNANKGLTYMNMESYINVFDNRDELLNAFKLVKKLSVVQKNKFLFVKAWFVAQFPDYDKVPSFSLVDNVIPLNAKLLDKAVEESKISA